MSDARFNLGVLAEREAMACIGCHDCMLACPLPEAAIVGIAELNAAVAEPVISNPNVVRFVSACTQCRQCVPVCPADLSRADMVLYNKLKVEDVVPDHALLIQVGAMAVVSSFTLDRLAADLGAAQLFAGVATADVRRLLLGATLRQLAPGDVLCGEGEFHERLTLVLSGALDQTSSTSAGVARILVLGPGSFFGELGVMADQPEPYTVVAERLSVVLELPKAAVHRLMDHSAAFAATMDELYRRRALWTYASKPGLLGGLPEAAMAALLADAELTVVRAGETLFRAGAAPEDAYLVRSGFLRVGRDTPSGEAVAVYFREGDLFGALALSSGERAQPYTVTGATRAEVIRIPGASLLRVLAAHPEARAAMASGEHERVARAERGDKPRAPALPSMVQPLDWRVLVDQGIAQGRELLVIDQHRCTNCNNCVDACGRRHGHSRLQLRGLQVEHLLFPTACRHCDDPVCLLCSVSGIVRRPGGEIAIVEENCIGCGACADRCPYGNISMHEVDPPKRGILARLVDMLRGGPPETGGDPRALRRAVKCDLCGGYDDYACVTACPVGAAFRVDPRSELAGGDVLIGLEMKKRSP